MRPAASSVCLVAVAALVTAQLRPAQVPSFSRTLPTPVLVQSDPSLRIHGGLRDSGRPSLSKRTVSTLEGVFPGHGAYYVTVTIGGVHLQLALDTASADLWVLSSDCRSRNCSSLPTFPLSFNSATFKAVNTNATAFNISYADATHASGFIGRETIALGNITVPDQALGFVNETSLRLQDRISGILGLGFPRLSRISSAVPEALPFFASIGRLGLAHYPLFGISITRSAGGGSLTFGAVDASVVRNVSSILWNPVVPFAPLLGASANSSIYLHWAVNIEGITVSGTPINPQPTYPNVTRTSVAILDYGTEGIFGPIQDVSRIFSSLDSSSRMVEEGLWAVPCGVNATMQFTIGTGVYTLRPRDYLIGPASGSPTLCLAWPRASQPNADGVDWQLGTPFLRTVYAVFSLGINTKEPPMIGLLSHSWDQEARFTTQGGATSTASPTLESSNASEPTFSPTITFPTTFPNFPLATLSYTIPPYTFNTSAGVPTPGRRVSTDLATSTYSPILRPLNTSAVSLIVPNVTLVTFIITESGGLVHTETSTAVVPPPSFALGQPPGSSATRHRLFVWLLAVHTLLVFLLD